MKKYTQEEFDNFPIIDGVKQCPTGDYSLIKVFAKRCRFGDDCSFAEGCSFAKRCRFAEGCSFAEWCIVEGKYNLLKYYAVDRIGSRQGKTYCFVCKEGVIIRCGCWAGTFDEFKKRVENSYPDIDNVYRKQYNAAIAFFEAVND